MNKEIDYLKEHLYEIYQYKKSMKDLTYDMDIEHLLRTCKALDYSQKEIERLNNILNKLEKELKEDYKIWMCNSRSNGRSVQFGIDVCKTHFYNRLQELKGSDK